MFRDTSKAVDLADIREIERNLEVTFPKQLIEHYLKYNGGNPINNFLYSEISDIETSVQTFLPLKYKNETGYTIEDMYRHFVGRNVFSGKYLPFAMDYGGNLFCVNMENGEIVMIWLDKGDVEEENIPVLSHSFDEFISSLEESEDY